MEAPSSLNPAALEWSRMYFIIKDRRSYPLRELFENAIKEVQLKIDGLASQPKATWGCGFSVCHQIPLNKSYAYTSFYFKTDGSKEIDFEAVKTKVLKVIQTCTLIDWAATTGQKKCIFSYEKFDEPHILNLNGRSYSVRQFITAIETTLYQDKDLRLEDIVLKPSMIQAMKLYPNLSMWKPLPEDIPKIVIFDEKKIEVQPFDEAKARMNNIAGFSEFLRALALNQSFTWDYKAMYNWYADARELPHYSDIGQAIENLVIRGIKFPPHHPKVDTGEPIVFKNILFENCDIDISCWCGLKVKSSQFVDCTFNLPVEPTLLKMTKLIRCTFKTKQGITYSSAGTIKHLEERVNALDLIRHIVEERENIVDGTFIVEK